MFHCLHQLHFTGQKTRATQPQETMSSLQRALDAAKKTKPTFLTSKGQFEQSFASGLDLTEFGNSSPDNAPQASAAAELLRVKEKEKRIKEEEEISEHRMRQVMKDRAADIDEAIRKNREGNIVVKALVQMHDTDTSDPSMFRKLKKRSKKLNSGRRPNNAAAATTMSTGKAHKKSRRSKY